MVEKTFDWLNPIKTLLQSANRWKRFIAVSTRLETNVIEGNLWSGPSCHSFSRRKNLLPSDFKFDAGSFLALGFTPQPREDDDHAEIFVKIGLPPLKYLDGDEITAILGNRSPRLIINMK